MSKLLSAVVILTFSISLSANAAKPNACSRAIEKCNTQIQALHNALSTVEERENPNAADQLSDMLQDKKIQCGDDISDACS
ncbi:MAG: hypothetical protein KC493_06200 [Bacteriovoracaceae bacterium]|nr:hypothetical protein [Bacteriovoracaceae bacterium]